MAAPLGASVKLILDFIKETQKETEFSAEDAKGIFGGSQACKLSDLTERQLLQYALISVYAQRDELIRYIESQPAPQQAQPNREQRRKLLKGS